MITYKSKTVIVIGTDRTGADATFHYVEAMGRYDHAPIEQLRADTIGELEETLTEAKILP